MGGSAQVPYMKKLSEVSNKRWQLIESWLLFSVCFDLDDATKDSLIGGLVLQNSKQKQFSQHVSEMGAMLLLQNEGYLEDVAVDKVLDFEQALIGYMRSEYSDFMKNIDETGEYSDEIAETLKDAITKFKETQTY